MPDTVSEATRQRITDVAIEAIRGRPIVALNAQDIAADAGVSTSAIYKAYGNKYELFAAGYIFCTFPTVFHGDADASVIEHAQALRSMMIGGLRTHVAAAVEAGDLAGDPAMLAELCAIDTFGYVGRSIASDEPITPEQYAGFMVGGLVHLDPELW